MNHDDERIAVALSRGEPVVIDGWLGAERASALRREILALVDAQRFTRAGVGAGGAHVVKDDVRRDSVCWFGADSEVPGVEVARFLARLDVLVKHLNSTCYLGLERVECHAACFEPGAFYTAHKDAFNDDARRVVSWCYYLNDAWDEAAGGCLRMDGGDIAPLLDRFVVFLSADHVHQVLPTTVRRLSLTGWLSRRP